MKKLKNLFLYCTSAILAFSFLIAPFSYKKSTQNASAEETIKQVELIDQTVLDYINISTSSQKITLDNIKSIDTNNDGIADTSYVFANGPVTLSFNLDYDYTLDYNNSLFFNDSHLPSHEVTLTETSPGVYPTSFTYNDKTYYYMIDDNNTIHLYENQASVPNTTTPFDGNDLVTWENLGLGLKIYFTTRLTLLNSSPSTTFKFSAFKGTTKPNIQYTINFEKSIADFATEDVVSFTCTGHDVGETPFTDTKIERELSYKNVVLRFTNNNYTENNPLFFDINYNGFIYNYKLYSKTITVSSVSKEYLFVEYFDTKKTNHNQSLATKINSVNGNIDVPVFKYDGDTTNFNIFSLEFNNTGRYEISVYDSTYTLGLKNNNYYSTSFYIKNETSSAFDNAYAILQSYDDDGNFIDYIVSDSTQNSDVKIIIKNMLYYFEKDDIIKNYETDESIKELNAIEFIKTTLTGSLNIPTSTFYTVGQVQENLKSTQDFIINCSEDAFFQINIFQYEETVDGDSNTVYTIDKTKTRSYQFTIVKQPKISYTVVDVDEEFDPIYMPGTTKYSTSIHEADTPFTIDTITYHININSDMTLKTNLDANDITFEKTYVNEYSINYAMQEVKVEEVAAKSDEEKKINALRLQFFGIGDINVTVTSNGVKTTYLVQSGDILNFEEYGTYSVTLVDSMGTTGAGVFSYKKPTSASSLILIGLGGFIVVAVVLFVIASRGKVKTR